MQRIRGALNRLSLAQQFMLACFIVLVFGMLGVGWWVGQQIENGVISRTAGQTALYVDSFVDPPLQNIGQGVQLTSKDMAALDRLVQNTPLGQHIVAFKIWDTQGRVLYSTNPALIGQQFPVKDELARSFAEWVNASGDFELATPQVLPIVNFRLKGVAGTEQDIAEAHAAMVDAITADGQRWISATQVAGRSVLRMMVISYLTEERHLHGLEQALTAALKTMALPLGVGHCNF